MTFEPWMLLIFPLFFGMGWLAARIDIKDLMSKSNRLPRSYFEGLNFLLNEQQDKAIESFIEVVTVDPQTIELHFALGSLFRRRGEIDRALRMHHNLLERTDLEAEQHPRAVFELAQDYLKAGILDRAEILFNELENSSHAKSSLLFLLELYQKEHDWHKAIGVAQRLPDKNGDFNKKLIAFFYCELALEARADKDWQLATDYLRQSSQIFPAMIRATILSGQVAFEQGQFQQAIDCWQQIEKQDGRYLPLVASRLLQAFKELDQIEQGVALLTRYLQHYPSLDLLDAVYEQVLSREGSKQAYQLVLSQLRAHPTLLGLEKLLEARLEDEAGDKRTDIELVKQIVHQHTRALAGYHCSHCGFKATKFYWHCPACQAWDSYSPLRHEETGLL